MADDRVRQDEFLKLAYDEVFMDNSIDWFPNPNLPDNMLC